MDGATLTTDLKPMRGYQTALADAVRQSIRLGHRYPIMQAATGCGKTRIASEIIRMATAKGNRCVFFAPRRELIYQSRDTFAELGLQVGVIMAGEDPAPSAHVQVASFDTVNARNKRGLLDLPPADLVIVDECHLAVSDTRLEILKQYRQSCIIGLTATPARGDGKGLGEIFDDIVHGPSISSLMADGYLVPVQYFAPREPNLAGVKTFRGDYQQRSLSERMNTPEEINGTVRSWKKYASDRSTVVFCVTREHGRSMCAAFKRSGVRAEYLDGDTPLAERKGILDRVNSGKTQVLVNILVATTGTDIPRLSCAILARPTKDVTLYLQTVGRVLRPCPEAGKRDAMVLDHSGAVLRHGFVDRPRPWTLESKEKIADATDRLSRERRDPKEIVCPKCASVFSGIRQCPHCGEMVVKPGKPIPVHRLDSDPTDFNTREGQKIFYATAKAYLEANNYQEGWLAHRYHDFFGVWPDADLKGVKPGWSSQEALDTLKRQMREYADRQRIAALRAKGLYGGEAWSGML